MIALSICVNKTQVVKGLARVGMLGTWVAGWAGSFVPVTLPSQAIQPVYLQPIPVDSAIEIPADLDEPGASSALSLPDLRTLPPTDLRIAPLAGGKRELRLSNTIWNSGQGPLELSGEINPVTSRTRVHQRITTSNGSLLEVFVGEFIWHPGHDHWHFEDFTLYELWSLQPNGGLDYVVVSSDKLSYCVIDTDPVDRENPAFSPLRNYFDCGQSLQGLSAGWGDTYKSHLDGQALDITHIPDGNYALVSSVNPGTILLEADHNNNRAVVLLEIRGNRLKVVTPEEIRRVNCRENCWS